jgi:hypothetical protein
MTLTAGLAIYGAVLSTLVFVWNVLRAGGRLRVSLIFGIETPADSGVVSGLYITIANHSGAPVYVTYAGILWPHRKVTVWHRLAHLARYHNGWRTVGWVHSDTPKGVDTALPTIVEPGQAHKVFLPHEAFATGLGGWRCDRLRAYAQDALGRNFYSRTYAMTPQQTTLLADLRTKAPAKRAPRKPKT